MSNKKSYMDKSNIVNEGILDKIFDFITKGKISKIKKDFKDNPKIKKKIHKLDQLSKEIESDMKKYGYTWKPSEGGWIKSGKGK